MISIELNLIFFSNSKIRIFSSFSDYLSSLWLQLHDTFWLVLSIHHDHNNHDHNDNNNNYDNHDNDDKEARRPAEAELDDAGVVGHRNDVHASRLLHGDHHYDVTIVLIISGLKNHSHP